MKVSEFHKCCFFARLRYKFDPEATAIMKKVSNTFRTGRTSVYTLFHYSQMITKKSFLAYNWSAEEENVTRFKMNKKKCCVDCLLLNENLRSPLRKNVNNSF